MRRTVWHAELLVYTVCTLKLQFDEQISAFHPTKMFPSRILFPINYKTLSVTLQKQKNIESNTQCLKGSVQPNSLTVDSQNMQGALQSLSLQKTS